MPIDRGIAAEEKTFRIERAPLGNALIVEPDDMGAS
jgi:hypothetical protein